MANPDVVARVSGVGLAANCIRREAGSRLLPVRRPAGIDPVLQSLVERIDLLVAGIKQGTGTQSRKRVRTDTRPGL